MNKIERAFYDDFGASQTSPLIEAHSINTKWNVNSLTITNDKNHIVTAHGNGNIDQISIDNKKPGNLKTLYCHKGAATQVRAQGNYFISVGQDGIINCFSLEDQSQKKLYDFSGKWIDALAIHEQKGLIAASSENTVVVVTLTGEIVYKRTDFPGCITDLVFDRNGSRLAMSRYNGITVSELESGQNDLTLEWKGAHINLTWSPEDRYIVSATQERELHAWDLVTGHDFRMGGYPRKVHQMDWLSNGPILVCSGADVVTAWSFDGSGPGNRPPLEIGYVFDGTVSAVAAHPSRSYVASGFSNGSVMIGGVTKGEALVAQAEQGSPVVALDWSSDGSLLSSATSKGKISLFTFSDSFDVR